MDLHKLIQELCAEKAAEVESQWMPRSARKSPLG
jgi:hypothetical protein